jgi:hypothetical protein
MVSILTSNAMEQPETHVKSIDTPNIKKVFSGKWRRLCSTNNCQKIAKINGQCNQHLKEYLNLAKSTADTRFIDINIQYQNSLRSRKCLVNNCETYSQKKGLCMRHFNQTEKQRQSIERENIPTIMIEEYLATQNMMIDYSSNQSASSYNDIVAGK